MKKLLACALMISLLGLFACKKSDQSQNQQAQAPEKSENFKPQKKKKNQQQQDQEADDNGGGAGKQAVPATLQVYKEKDLVKSIPQTDFASLTTTKIKAGNKDVQAISMKDFLAKYGVKGKNVVLTGEQRTAAITWEQANSGDLYLMLTPRGRLKLYSANKSAAGQKLPKRIDSITVSDSATPTAPAPQSKPAA